ncbi:MAG: hypothetical protein MOB07_00295 [Acidobacteria bacterium]|nr:hypothetical protein [Acidobacteriota bacterium]
MKSASMFIVLSTISLMFLVSLPATAQTQAEKWEYKIVNICRDSRDSELNKLGDLGWELVAVTISDGSCPAYYFKAPRGSIVSITPSHPPVPAPKCTLTLAQAPVIRGIRLGMSTDELLALFPRSRDQFQIREALSKAEINFGESSLFFSSREYPENEVMFNKNLQQYAITLFDGRVVTISVGFNFQPVNNIYPNWTVNTWIAKLSETYNLPKPEEWGPDRRSFCQGFEIEVSVQAHYASMLITNPAYRQQIKQRQEAEYEKQRRAFKP